MWVTGAQQTCSNRKRRRAGGFAGKQKSKLGAVAAALGERLDPFSPSRQFHPPRRSQGSLMHQVDATSNLL